MHSWVQLCVIAETMKGRHHSIRRVRVRHAGQKRGWDVVNCIDDRRRRRKGERPAAGSGAATETGAVRMTLARMCP